MSGRESGEAEVEQWDRTRAWTRSLIEATRPVGHQPKWWVALLVAAGLAVMVVLAVTRAPDIAYVVLMLVIYMALCADMRRRKDEGQDHPPPPTTVG